jgi:hypothetical protein
MSKFLKFNIVDSAAPLTQGTELVNVDQIQSVSYVAGTGVLSIVLAGAVGADVATYAGRVINITVTTTKDGTAGVPTITNGSKSPQKAVYAALTANPLQMYFSDFAIATELIA